MVVSPSSVESVIPTAIVIPEGTSVEAAVKPVVARTTGEDVVAAPPQESVVARPAPRDVITVEAVESVVVCTATEVVVALTSLEPVGTGSAVQPVVAPAADHVIVVTLLSPESVIALTPLHSVATATAVEEVVAISTGKDVPTSAAMKLVVAASPREMVAVVATVQGIVAAPARARVGFPEQRVDSRTAVEHVVAITALEVVVAGPAKEVVVAITALDVVVSSATMDSIVSPAAVHVVVVLRAAEGVRAGSAMKLGHAFLLRPWSAKIKRPTELCSELVYGCVAEIELGKTRFRKEEHTAHEQRYSDCTGGANGGCGPPTDLLRTGARRSIEAAVSAECEEYPSSSVQEMPPDGRQRVVRNGPLPERKILTGLGEVAMRIPKACGRRSSPEPFRSSVMPPDEESRTQTRARSRSRY